MTLAERDPDDVAAIATEVGAVVTERQPQADGSTALVIDCPTVLCKLDLLVALGRHDGERFADVHKLARSIVAPRGDDDASRLEAIQLFVQSSVGFCFEAGEVYPSALTVLGQGIGDCDDHTIVVVALCHALGYPTSAEAFFWPSGDGHVGALSQLGGQWLWIETTIPARLGEHPVAAAKRLGITTRGDVHG